MEEHFEKSSTPSELIEAFEAIEKYDLKINTIICTVCGCRLSENDKNIPCEHLKSLIY